MDYNDQNLAHPELSVLVVNFNTRDITLECLRSLHRETSMATFELLVWDNASSDGSVAAIRLEFPDAKVFESQSNLGFGVANNELSNHARGEKLLLLNPDTVVLSGAVDRLLAFSRANPDARLVGGRTLHPDRSLAPGSCWGAPTLWSTACLALGLSSLLPGSRLFNPEALPGWRRDSVREVDIVAGCWLMIDRDLWSQLGGFDPSFFMYGEDADLCMRARAAGALIQIDPSAEVIHIGGASEKVRADKMVKLLTAKAQLVGLHWGPCSAWLGLRLVDTWALCRVVIFLCLAPLGIRFREGLNTWWKVWSARDGWRKAFKRASARGKL